MTKFHYHLSDEGYHDNSTTVMHLLFILSKGFIVTLFTTVWDYNDGCAEKYFFTYAIFLLSFIDLYIFIVIDRTVGSPVHVKYVLYCTNDRDKLMPKLKVENILNSELICYHTFHKFIRIH